MRIEVFTDDDNDDRFMNTSVLIEKYMQDENGEEIYNLDEDNKELRYFPSFSWCYSGYGEKNQWLVALEGKKIVGCLKLRVDGDSSSGFPKYNKWVCFVTVHSDHRKQGISKKLLRAMFEHCSRYGIVDILGSSYTKDGQQCLRHQVDPLCQEFPEVKYFPQPEW